MITNEEFWAILKRIPEPNRRNITKLPRKMISGSERMLLMRSYLPYNTLRIIEEAANVARKSGLACADRWGIDQSHAFVGLEYDTPNFHEVIPHDDNRDDAEKIAALRVLAAITEYVKSI